MPCVCTCVLESLSGVTRPCEGPALYTLTHVNISVSKLPIRRYIHAVHLLLFFLRRGQVGDFVAIDFKDETNGWWVGTNTRTGESGMFPGSHCKLVEWTGDSSTVGTCVRV
jgi:hypothetical protein